MTTIAERINEALKPVFTDKENPNYIDLSKNEEGEVREVIRVLMVQMPISILGSEANLIGIAGDILGEYFHNSVKEAYEYGVLEERTKTNEQHKETTNE